MGNDAAVAGHNSELSDVERKTFLFSHFNPIFAQNEVVKKEREALKKLRKKAKGEGITLADIDFMMRCADVDDPTIVPDELRRRTEIASWFALPVQFQPDFFKDRAPALERIEAEGLAAGLSSKNPESGQPKASPEDAAWLKGWEAGQAQMRDGLKSAMDKKNAAKTETADNVASFPIAKKAKAKKEAAKKGATDKSEVKTPEPA